MAGFHDTLERYRVHSSTRSWSSVYEGGEAVDRAEKSGGDGHAYESEGALWLRTTALAGDEKDGRS